MEYFVVDKSVLGVDVTEISNQKAMNEARKSVVDQSGGRKKYKQQLKHCVSPKQQLDFAKQAFRWIPISPENLAKYSKNSEIFADLSMHGHSLMARGKFEQGLILYNLAVMFGNAEDGTLGTAYLDRAGALLVLGKPQEALVDSELALVYDCTDKEKQAEWRLACEESIRLKTDKDETNERELRKEFGTEMELREKICQEIRKIENPNPLMPAVADFVGISYNENLGRHLVVNKDVQAGTVLLIELPYAGAIKSELDWSWKLEYCHRCMKNIRRGIPCKKCVFAIYCDESCLQEAYDEYHKYECDAMVYLHCHSVSTHKRLALRTICKVGPDELCRVFKTQDPNYFGDQAQGYGTRQDCKYESDSYLPMYHLQTHSDKRNCWTRHEHAMEALLLAAILDEQSSFFEKIPQEDKADFKDFIAELLLRHIESAGVNAEVIEEYVADRGQFSPIDVGSGVYPAYSLVSHSCDPNVQRVTDNMNGKLIVLATRALKKGEPIFNSYNAMYPMNDLTERQAMLMGSHYFQCRCIACLNDWPTFEKLLSMQCSFTCPPCSRNFYQHEKVSKGPEFKKCLLSKPDWKCGLCGKRYKERQLYQRLSVNNNLAREADLKFVLNCPGEAISILRNLFEYYQFHVSPPNGREQMMQGTFMKCIAMILHQK